MLFAVGGLKLAILPPSGLSPTPIIVEFFRVATGGGFTIRFQCFGERRRLDAGGFIPTPRGV